MIRCLAAVDSHVKVPWSMTLYATVMLTVIQYMETVVLMYHLNVANQVAVIDQCIL